MARQVRQSMFKGLNPGAVHKLIKELGFKKIGEGAFAAVYGRKGCSYVLKFGYADKHDGWLQWAEKVMGNKNKKTQKNLPKIFWLEFNAGEGIYVCKMERLKSQYNASGIIGIILGELATYNANNKKVAGLITPKVIADIINVSSMLKTKRHCLDLHDANIMWRGNTPVITDPWC